MAKSPIADTVAAIARSEAMPLKEILATAREDAVINLAAAAMRYDRRLGKRDMGEQSRINEIFNNRNKRQARRLLIAAVLHLYGLDALFERKILGGLSRYDLAGANDEALSEICDGLEDAAREEARECRERLSDF